MQEKPWLLGGGWGFFLWCAKGLGVFMHIRRFKSGEERTLYEIYFSAIHLIASANYTPDQINAWAPRDVDQTIWERKIQNINPFVVELSGELVGYADLQPTGYIDHFFVSGRHPRLGVGTQLMEKLKQEAKSLGLLELSADVSRTAQPFFEKFGFVVVEQRFPERHGVVIPNALMRNVLTQEPV